MSTTTSMSTSASDAVNGVLSSLNPRVCAKCGYTVHEWNAEMFDNLEQFQKDIQIGIDEATGAMTLIEFYACPDCVITESEE